MKHICKRCGSDDVVSVKSLEKSSYRQRQRTTLFMIALGLEKDLTALRSRFAWIITKVFGRRKETLKSQSTKTQSFGANYTAPIGVIQNQRKTKQQMFDEMDSQLDPEDVYDWFMLDVPPPTTRDEDEKI